MISVVTTWRDRIQIREFLPPLSAEIQALGGDITIVNYGGSCEQLASLIESLRQKVRIVHRKRTEFFNKSAAQNIGAYCSDRPLLFFCDCDILLNKGALTGLIESVHARENLFGTLEGVKESLPNSREARHITRFGYELNMRTADGRILRIIDHEEDAETGLRQAPGLLLIRRNHFEQIGGYNSQLHGWGWEDQDMISRLTLGLGLTRVSSGTAIHISHGDHERVGSYPQRDRWESRDRMFRTALRNYDSADFIGSYLSDIERESKELTHCAFTEERR